MFFLNAFFFEPITKEKVIGPGRSKGKNHPTMLWRSSKGYNIPMLNFAFRATLSQFLPIKISPIRTTKKF